jgi:arylsulfatase
MMPFDHETIDVMIAGYLSRDAAFDDFESVRHSGGYLHGATVVSKDLEGNLSAEQTDHMVRDSARSMATVGLVMGLFVPPLLLASTAVGAATGAGAGMLLHRWTAHELKERAGATIPIGGAGLIVAYPKSSAETVRPAVKRAISIAIGEAEGNRLKALTGALADAQRKMATATG